jgi:hypothetical protein
MAALALIAGCSTAAQDSQMSGVGGAGAGGASGLGGAGGASGAGGTGGSAGAGGAGGTGGTGGATGASSGPTYSRVWTEVLSGKTCAGEFCHGSGTGTLWMNDKEDAYANLVGVPAMGPDCTASGKLRVSPGQPEASLLLDKMSSATPSCGKPMPIGVRFEPNCIVPDPAACTTANELELVRAWIAAGALND